MAVRPCFVAFFATTDLPAGVLGPVEDWAFSWLAVICAAVDMAGSLGFEMGKGNCGGLPFLGSRVAGGLRVVRGWVCKLWGGNGK